MTTLRQKIQKPFIILLICIPLTILILFNFSINQYVKVKSKNDLQFVSENIPSGYTADEVTTIFPYISSQLGNSSIDIIVYNKLGTTAEFMDSTYNFVDAEIEELVYNIIKDLPLGEIVSFTLDKEDYYLIEVEFNNGLVYDKIVYIVNPTYLDDLIRVVNLLLLGITLLTTSIAIIISNKISKSISTPIEYVVKSIEKLEPNEVLPLNTSSDSEEIQKLVAVYNEMSNRIYNMYTSQSKFIQNASHELRTPLMNIQGYSDGLKLGVFDDVSGTAEMISSQTKRLSKIVNNLLTLARVENYDKDTELSKINLSESLQTIINEYAGYALQNKIEIKSEIIPNIYVSANNELLFASIGNILANALRYASNEVLITLKQDIETAIIVVKDDGKGIENINKIYDRFSKGSKGNYGLGLTIAKSSIDALNGSIEAYNDNGAVFIIELNLI